ncbi:MAG TPA: TonB-dependent receptor, partial [Desulfobacterales bacterium]|nr:TonB-dependent receptor [Desulfobacterales bacterium]
GMIRAYTSHYEKDYEKRYIEGPMAGTISGGGTDFDEGSRDTSAIEASGSTDFSSLFGDHILTFGGEFRNENYESARINNNQDGFVCRDSVCIPLGTYDRDSYAVYMQDEWMMGERFTLIPSVRYDKYDGFDAEWSPKVGIIFQLTEQWRAKANYGHSFRVPGVGELFRDYYGMGGRYHIIGNENLNPETSDSFDIAVETSGKSWFARLGYFYNDVDDLIHTEFHGIQQRAYTFVYENIDRAKLQGVELEGSWQATESLRLGMNYTYLDARDDTTDERLTGKPRHLTTGKLDYTCLPWDLTFNLRVRYMGDYGYIVGGRGTAEEFKNDSEFITSVKLTKGISDNVDFYVGADNIFDNYAAYYGRTADDGVLENPGLFYYAGIKISY